MSSLANWSYTSTLTIWKELPEDKYGDASGFDTPYTLSGSWEEGGELATDDEGEEFQPASTYYIELARGSVQMPERGDYIAIGDQTATANPLTIDAERIKKVGGWDMSAFGDSELPDWKILT